jgi:hypothetical protein
VSKEYPNEKLEQVIHLAEAKILPIPAKEWAQSALNTAVSIQMTIESMHSNGVEAPTDAQSRALENIYLAACRWIGDLKGVVVVKKTLHITRPVESGLI